MQGTIHDELFWLRSWTNETYLWNDEVPDENPSNYASAGTPAYFDTLKTSEITTSGTPKDDFHFYESTEEYLLSRNSAPRSGYGARFAVLQGSPPRDVRVLYTEPNSPASNTTGGEAPFQRGARILEVDGVDVVNGNDVDALNNGLFPANSGETHTFVVQDVGEASRSITITSADVVTAPVNKTAVLDVNGDKVGYILFNTFSPFASEEAIATAMTEMSDAGVSDLVLDLRYNGGGLLAVAAQTGYMIAGSAQSNGKTFEYLQFNDDAGNRDPVTGEINDPIPFIDTGVGFSLASGTPLDSLNLNRVFILSTGGTCSASEAVINGLRGIDVEVILIGDITCGKPYGFYPTSNCGTTWYSIQFQGVNDKGFGDYADGFVPDNSSFAFGARAPGCVVADDYNNELGDPNEGLLSTALYYRENGACPASAPKPAVRAEGQKTVFLGEGELATTDRTPGELIRDNNRDLRMPY
tara:strand:+ start:9665 stop:11071 length:1407 start_codon:yes stop_codon:yes gene_type:complete